MASHDAPAQHGDAWTLIDEVQPDDTSLSPARPPPPYAEDDDDWEAMQWKEGIQQFWQETNKYAGNRIHADDEPPESDEPVKPGEPGDTGESGEPGETGERPAAPPLSESDVDDLINVLKNIRQRRREERRRAIGGMAAAGAAAASGTHFSLWWWLTTIYYTGYHAYQWSGVMSSAAMVYHNRHKIRIMANLLGVW